MLYDLNHELFSETEQRELIFRKCKLQKQLEASDLPLEIRGQLEDLVYNSPNLAKIGSSVEEKSYARVYSDLLSVKETLRKGNLRYAVQEAKRRTYGNMAMLEENIHLAIIGLVEAIDNVDSDKGDSFFPLAKRYIQRKISDSISSSRLIRLPNNVRGKLLKADRKFKEEHHRVPSLEELHIETGYELGVISIYRGFYKRLDKKLFDSEFSLYEFFSNGVLNSPSMLIEDSDLKEQVRKLLDSLPDLEREIVRSFFGFDGPPEIRSKIAKRMGLHSNSVTWRLNKALRSLKMNARSFGLTSGSL